MNIPSLFTQWVEVPFDMKYPSVCQDVLRELAEFP